MKVVLNGYCGLWIVDLNQGSMLTLFLLEARMVSTMEYNEVLSPALTFLTGNDERRVRFWDCPGIIMLSRRLCSRIMQDDVWFELWMLDLITNLFARE